MTNQNKTHAVNVGSVYKPNGKSGLNNAVSDGAIINHFGADATGNSIHAMGVARIGYNRKILKPMQYPRTESVFFHAPNNGVLFALVQANSHTSTGDVGSGNAPTVIGSRTSPTFFGGTQSLNPMEGIMPKNSNAAAGNTSTISIQSNTLTLEQAKARAFETVPLFAVYVYINGGVDKDDITRGVPRFVGHYTDRKEADKAGLHALTHTANAVCCDVKDIGGAL